MNELKKYFENELNEGIEENIFADGLNRMDLEMDEFKFGGKKLGYIVDTSGGSVQIFDYAKVIKDIKKNKIKELEIDDVFDLLSDNGIVSIDI